MEMDKGHTSVRRGVSWSPGGLRKPLQATQNTHTPGTECNASWETTGFNKEQMSRKTNLTRSASLSEKELKEARVRSQIIAAQLTVPSNSSSRGVQLFNRRKQRVSAFTLESCGEGSGGDRVENVKTDPSTNQLTWAERSTEEKDRDLNFKNSKPLLSPPGTVRSAGDIMEEPGKDFYKEDDMEDSVIQERHFLPVKEEQEEEEEEEARDKIHKELEDKVKDEIPPGSNNTDPVLMRHAEGEAEINRGHTGPVPPGKLHNGCHSTSGPGRVPVPTSKQTSTIINRTARPFFSPLTVQSPEAASPVMDIPPPPSYDTPPLPAFTAPQPLAFSPPPPPPSYPTPPLPAFTNQPPQTYYSSPPLMSPVMSPPLPEFPVCSVSQYPPMPHYGPPTAPKPSTFVPQPAGERKLITPMKSGILEEGAARRGNRKSMFTFKEKTVVAPNPELLSLVQGVDERKKHGHRSMPEPASEEELLALGAEASNFLAKEEDRAEEARSPEWASCLKTSRTRPRADHMPEQSLTNVSGKGAELFAKRQSRMEKYVVEKQNSGQIRSPSPTMSLPPSWVYPANMPGRVKAIAKNSDMGAQLSQNLQAQQAVKQKPRQKAPAPEPIPEPPLENGCSKIEMDLSRHRPYQLSSSLFILNPVKDPLSTLPRGAPQSKNLISTQPFSRQTALLHNPPSHFSTQHMSSQMPLSPTRGGAEYPPNPAYGQPRISSPMSAFSPERVSSPRSGVQAPRPMFSAKKAGIAPQTPKDSSSVETPSETPTPTRTPILTRRFSSPEGPATGTWTPSIQTNRPSTTITSRSVTSPVSSPRGTRCQSPMASQNIQFSAVTSTTTSRPSQTFTATSPRSPPWGSRCQSPMVNQNTQSSSISSITGYRPSQTSMTTSPLSPPWGSRCQSPMVNQYTQSSTVTSTSTSRPSQTSTATSPRSPPWGSRCQSPMLSQNSQSSTISFVPTSRPTQTSKATSPVSPPWGSRSQSPALSQTSLSFPATKPLYTSSATSSVPPPKDSRCMSPNVNNPDSKANHRLLAKNIINAAKRKNSPSPGALSGHSLPISPLGNSHHGYDCHKPPISHFQSRAFGAQSPTFTSPPPTPTQRICSPVRLYNTRSLTDSDASVESEDSGLRSPGLHSYNTCPRGWGGSLRVKRSTVSTDL
ncbi:synaptopodin isoform X2 [Cottoperca gobio]|uniref:Synaptopodin isoform X2 n=1 Tax=Cottoperca gobio TaxID=56716 RepID=A0A6J2QHR4_COTGO|nr:synaptopodin isoform X2 [Cottoperca gobio]XP_029296975.1 synaptopodin isoform X2 [Cottoperca gobio]